MAVLLHKIEYLVNVAVSSPCCYISIVLEGATIFTIGGTLARPG